MRRCDFRKLCTSGHRGAESLIPDYLFYTYFLSRDIYLGITAPRRDISIAGTIVVQDYAIARLLARSVRRNL